MADLLLDFDDAARRFDLATDKAAFTPETGLRTAIALSLFLDRRAQAGDGLRETEDPRGWWGDAIDDDGDETGSRLWLLARESLSPDDESIVVRAEDYVREALAWLLEDGVAAELGVEAEIGMPDRIQIAVTVHEPSGTAQRFEYVWEAIRA